MSFGLEPGREYTAFPVGCRGTIDVVVDGKSQTLKPDGAPIKAGRIEADEIIVDDVRLSVRSRGDRQVILLSESAPS